MNSQPNPGSPATIPAIVEDLFLTGAFLIKGRIANKYQRLRKMLEDADHTFLAIEEATMVSLRGGEVIRTPSVMVNRSEIIFAHELVDTASDDGMRQLATNQKSVRIRAFHSGNVQLELAGLIDRGAYQMHKSRHWYFVMQDPKIRGLNIEANDQLKVLESLPYIIVRKDKLSYVYDFSRG